MAAVVVVRLPIQFGRIGMIYCFTGRSCGIRFTVGLGEIHVLFTKGYLLPACTEPLIGPVRSSDGL